MLVSVATSAMSKAICGLLGSCVGKSLMAVDGQTKVDAVGTFCAESVGECEDGETGAGPVGGGPHTLSLSSVPLSTSVRCCAWQSVCVWHLSVFEATAEKVPRGHLRQRTSSVSLPCFRTPQPGWHSEWGRHSPAWAKLPGGHAHVRSEVAVQGVFSTKGVWQGFWQRWHCCTPFSPRVKVPSGQRMHSRTLVSVQWDNT